MVILNTFIYPNILFLEGVKTRWMICYTNDAFFFFLSFLFSFYFIIIIKAMWIRVWADVMCFHHNENSLMFRA